MKGPSPFVVTAVYDRRLYRSSLLTFISRGTKKPAVIDVIDRRYNS
jgi:hypothetical protein